MPIASQLLTPGNPRRVSVPERTIARPRLVRRDRHTLYPKRIHRVGLEKLVSPLKIKTWATARPRRPSSP